METLFLSYTAYADSEQNPPPNSINCDFNIRPSGDQVCRVGMNMFGPCTAPNGYGFNESKPCIFLKLNRVSWQKILEYFWMSIFNRFFSFPRVDFQLDPPAVQKWIVLSGKNAHRT